MTIMQWLTNGEAAKYAVGFSIVGIYYVLSTRKARWAKQDKLNRKGIR